MSELRIIGGRLGGRRFRGPAGDATRPTSERVREALASALDSRGAIEGAVVLDLYAGTGALAFEMLSRGAGSAVCVEASPSVAKALGESARKLGIAPAVVVSKLDAVLSETTIRAVRGALRGEAATLVIADPPYAIAADALSLFSSLREHQLAASDALLVLECSSRSVPDAGTFVLEKSYRYGDTQLLLLRFSDYDEAVS
jgi:16S rRNA (guanine966-N2)-methyltransferase